MTMTSEELRAWRARKEAEDRAYAAAVGIEFWTNADICRDIMGAAAAHRGRLPCDLHRLRQLLPFPDHHMDFELLRILDQFFRVDGEEYVLLPMTIRDLSPFPVILAQQAEALRLGQIH